MALSRFVLTATVTVPPGAYTADVIQGTPGTVTGTGAPANFGTGSYAQSAGHYGAGGAGVAGGGGGSSAAGLTFFRGQVIWADSSGAGGAGALYTAIGAGNLRAWVDGQDTVGHAALAN